MGHRRFQRRPVVKLDVWQRQVPRCLCCVCALRHEVLVRVLKLALLLDVGRQQSTTVSLQQPV